MGAPQLIAATFVAVVSLAAIVAPFALAITCRRDEGGYRAAFFMAGVLALVWIGFTALRMIAGILGSA